MTRRSRLAAVLLLLHAGAAAPLAAQEQRAVREPTAYEVLQMFSQVLNQIRVNHPDSLNTHVLIMAAVEAMVRAADPHSYVLPATRLAPDVEQAWRTGKLVPVPIAFRFVGDAAVVVATAPGTLAAQQDILPGDELIAAAGVPIRAESEAELDISLAGPSGSVVSLEFERRRADGSRVRLVREVRRERAEDVHSAVVGAHLLDGGVGYVRVTTFANPRVADDLHDTLGKLEDQGMRALVLDLRDNGGGLLDEAARIAGEFLPRGAVVYTSSGRKEGVTDTVRVSRSFWRSERRYPIVVLVNHGTASAAELVAGALQDHDRALIVGRPTFGKALMMQPFPLTDGSLLVLVVGTVRTPCGRSIQRDYRSITRREYYRGEVAAPEREGRPSCTTAAGRTVYGGGGIQPDVLLPEPPPRPLWLARALEADLPLKWAGGYVDEHGASWQRPAELAAGGAADAAIADFRAYAAAQGIEIPATPESDAALRLVILPRLAATRWGADESFRILAALDPEVGRAAAEVAHAAELVQR